MRRTLERLGLAFQNPSMERLFWHEYIGQYRPLIMGIMFFGGLAFYGFFVWDNAIDAAGARSTHPIRAEIMFLIWLCVLGCLIPAMHRHLEWLQTIAVSVASIGLAAIYTLLANGYDYSSSGLVLIIMFAASLLPLRLPFFVAFCAATLIAFFVGQAASPPSRPGLALANALVMICASVWGVLAVAWREWNARGKFLAQDQLAASRARIEELLHQMLPTEIVGRIQAGAPSVADAHGEVSIVFADLVGFTELSRRISPSHLVETLNSLFSGFDEEADRHGIERIKTIGDAYMAVGGIGDTRNHAARSADFALAIRRVANRLTEQHGFPLQIRIGLHVGPIVAGVIGKKRPAFDCWGESVNLASRLEHAAQPGAILISESAYWRLRDQFLVEVSEEVELKGIGRTRVYRLLDRLSATEETEPAVA
jgi:adenylate cyclase